MVKCQGIRSPSMVPHFMGVVESLIRQSNDHSDNPSMEHSSVVSSITGVNSVLPNPTTLSTTDNSPTVWVQCRPLLVALKFSSKDSELEKFRTEVLTLSSVHGERKPTQITIQVGGRGKICVPSEGPLSLFVRYSKHVRQKGSKRV